MESFLNHLQILNENGSVDNSLMPSLTKNEIIRMYELMVFSRMFDDKLLAMQRQGKIGTFAQAKGQEACQVGSCYALKQEDWMFPAFRENGVFLVRGMPLDLLFQFCQSCHLLFEPCNLYPDRPDKYLGYHPLL